MAYSIDWANEWVASLRWIGIATAISLVALVLVGFLVVRFTSWGRQFWRVNREFFIGTDTRVSAWLLIVVLTVFSLAGVRLSVIFSYFSNDLYTAMQTVAEGISSGGAKGSALVEAGKTAFWHSMTMFALLATIHVVRTMVEIYIGSAFEMRWRTSLTNTVMNDWLKGKAYYRNRFATIPEVGKGLKFHPGVDNPDQRIESDIDNVTTATSGTSFRTLIFSGSGDSTSGVIPAIASVIAFTQILWNLSGPLTLWSVEIPRAMVWLVYMFVLIATVIAFWIGRPLIR
ncbi:MAG: SbmA/BacA-like family transporter, partial [Gordonia sp. (in: high G+C Gram-positive bacteria)]